MTAANSEERAERRAAARRHSGMQIGCIWSATLVILLIIYLVSMAILRHFNYRSWSESINNALKKGDIANAEALIESCRRDNPELTKRPDFAVWERQLATLKNKEAQKVQRFDRKLRQLQKQLDAEDADPQLLLMRLTEAARECPDASQLEQLREMQLRCEALARMRELVSAQSGAQELSAIQTLFDSTTQTLQQNDYARTFEILDDCDHRTKLLVQKYYNIHEIAEQGRLLQKKIRRQRMSTQAAQRNFQDSEKAFSQLVLSASAALLEHNCQNFLQKYPASFRCAAVRNLLRELPFLNNQQWLKQLKEQQLKQQHSLQNTQKYLIAEIKNFMTKNFQAITYELVLQTADRQLLRLECYTPQTFSAPDKNGMISIAFNTVDDRKVKGEFTSDGNGKVQINNRIYQGKLVGIKPVGELPQPYWQRRIVVLDGINSSLDVLEFMTHTLPALINDRQLPEHLRQQLAAINKQATARLGSTPQQYIFTREILDFCSKSKLRFAGVRIAGENVSQIHLIAGTPLSASLWQIVFHNGQLKVEYLGTVQKPNLTDSNNVCILAVPENSADYRQQFILWQQQALREKLYLPKLPAFMQFK